jgi:hypothetical protein
MRASRLIKELGRIESGHMKALVTCATEYCPNSREINLTNLNRLALQGGTLKVECSACEASRNAERVTK